MYSSHDPLTATEILNKLERQQSILRIDTPEEIEARKQRHIEANEEFRRQRAAARYLQQAEHDAKVRASMFKHKWRWVRRACWTICSLALLAYAALGLAGTGIFEVYR